MPLIYSVGVNPLHLEGAWAMGADSPLDPPLLFLRFHHVEPARLMGFRVDSVRVGSRYTVATTREHISGYLFLPLPVTATVTTKKARHLLTGFSKATTLQQGRNLSPLCKVAVTASNLPHIALKACAMGKHIRQTLCFQSGAFSTVSV